MRLVVQRLLRFGWTVLTLVIASLVFLFMSTKDLLWYMSKEVFRYENMSNTTGSDGSTAATDNTHMTVTSGPVQQIFSFWAPLTQYTESIQSPFLLHYPNFTTSSAASVPSSTRRPTAWHSLSTTNRHFMDQPPIVELVEWESQVSLGQPFRMTMQSHIRVVFGYDWKDIDPT